MWSVLCRGGSSYTYDSAANRVENLIINNAVITTQTTRSLAGIAAGYVNDARREGVLNNVQVSGNSTINSTATEALTEITPNLSDYTLVGYTNYTESPVYAQNTLVYTPKLANRPADGNGGAIIGGNNGAGGNLEIKPNGRHDETSTAIKALTPAKPAAKVPGSSDMADGTPSATFRNYVFLADTTSDAAQFSGPTNVFMFQSTVSFSGQSTQIVYESSGNWTNGQAPAANSLKEMQDFYNYSSTIFGSKAYYLYFKSVPGIVRSVTGTGKKQVINTDQITEGQKIDSLGNCVWFKPMGSGICALGFLHTSNNTTDYMSVYRFKRDGSGNIAAGTLSELRFELTPNHGNNSVNYYSLQITQEEYEAGYEYAIGAAPGSNEAYDAGFFYLMLAAADNTGGPGVIQGTLGSDYALYEEYDYSTASLELPHGVLFSGDPLTTFRINPMGTPHSSVYAFSSANGSVTTSDPMAVDGPGSAGDVVKQNYTAGGVTTNVKTITGYDESGNITIIMKKTQTSAGSLVYESWTDVSRVWTTASSATDIEALEKYFSAADVFSNEQSLNYYHRIADENALLLPESAVAVNSTPDANGVNVYSFNSYTITAPAASTAVSVEPVKPGLVYEVRPNTADAAKTDIIFTP